MRVKLFLFTLMTVAFGFSALFAGAQTSRKAVGAAEVNGTFRLYFKGKFKNYYNEIQIFALGKNRLRVSFELLYPYLLSDGEMTVNMGDAYDFAEISGDAAIFTTNEFGGNCKITIKFVKPGTIRVNQDSTESACGFGNNVTANGTYKKFSSRKPKFDKN